MAEAREKAPKDRLQALKSTGVVGLMTLLSRVFGLIRDMVFARLFGAGPVMDAFFVAFKIPNLLRRFFGEGAFAQAFVPVISEYRSQRGGEPTKELVDAVTGTLGLVLVAITVVGVLAAPLIILVFAPGFVSESGGDDRYDMAVAMLRWTFPYLLFISLTGLAGGVLNTYRRFAVPAFTPVLLNLVLIGFAIFVSPTLEQPGMALAIGVFVAGAVQLAFQLPFLAQLGMLPRPRWGKAHEGVRRIVKLMLPVMFGSSVAQINILFDTLIASFLAAGSITWLYFSDRLMEFPLGVFGIALATVILPGLSEDHAQRESREFSATLDWALRLVMMIAVPAALGLIVLAEPLMATIFYGGRFNEHDVAMASASLVAYGFGLVGFTLVKVLSPGYFARQDTRTPVRIGVFAVGVNMALNVVFVVFMVRNEVAAPHAGLALATTCSALINAALLWRGLRRSGIYQPAGGWLKVIGQVILAGAAMVAVLVWILNQQGDWFAVSVWKRIIWLTVVIGGGAACYFLVLALCGVRIADFRGNR